MNQPEDTAQLRRDVNCLLAATAFLLTLWLDEGWHGTADPVRVLELRNKLNTIYKNRTAD